MEWLQSGNLCARLTANVSSLSPEEFYEKFNLINSTYSEFHFKDMLEIFHLPGMDQWPNTMEETTPDLQFSLICFFPPSVPAPSWPSLNEKRIAIAHSLASDMICSSFESKEDHESINAAMAIFPTLAIFMSVVVEQGKKKKASKKTQLKSILDAKDSTTIKCLAAVNYFRQHMHTQVLWLATTLEEPPTESIHCYVAKAWSWNIPVVHASQAAHRNWQWQPGR
ncbi:MAG: hypothetical protein MZV65_38675 [Chromatiales bacterium]|nr:hypothetical protein [Chromatiales bacterium]